MMMTKRNAFLIHLGFSLLIFLILLLMIVYVWYPAPYFDASYRMKWIKIIAFVDVVLGPVLTLIIFKPGKPHLKMDMTVILLVQLSALSWGVYNAWSIHPKMTVFYDNAVYCLDRSAVHESKADSQFATSPMKAQVSAILPYPDTEKLIVEYFGTGDLTKSVVFRHGEKFISANTEATEELGKYQSDIQTVVNKNDHNKQEWNAFVANFDRVNPDWRFYPFICLEKKKTLVLDRKNNKVEGVLDFRIPSGFVLD